MICGVLVGVLLCVAYYVTVCCSLLLFVVVVVRRCCSLLLFVKVVLMCYVLCVMCYVVLCCVMLCYVVLCCCCLWHCCSYLHEVVGERFVRFDSGIEVAEELGASGHRRRSFEAILPLVVVLLCLLEEIFLQCVDFVEFGCVQVDCRAKPRLGLLYAYFPDNMNNTIKHTRLSRLKLVSCCAVSVCLCCALLLLVVCVVIIGGVHVVCSVTWPGR